jgi:ERCC4-type nuclease
MGNPTREEIFKVAWAIVDTREGLPLDLLLPKCVKMGLDTADYSLVGLETLIRIERKSTQDLVNCCGAERERFLRCLDRLRTFKFPMLVIEGSEATVELRQYRGEVHPNAVIESVNSWRASGIYVEWAGDRVRAARLVSRTLYFFAKKHYAHLKKFHERYALKEGTYVEFQSGSGDGKSGSGPGASVHTVAAAGNDT